MITTVIEVEVRTFQRLFERFPELRMRLVDVRSIPTASALFWFGGVEADALDDTLESDPEVVQGRHLETVKGEHLYSVSYSESSQAFGLYQALVDLDAGVVEATGQGGSWRVKLFFPSREAISTFFARASELGASPVLHSVTTDHPGPKTKSYGLTPLQRETLVIAAQLGYFSVPKEVSLVDLANELDISDQAASERLRRGISALIENTIREVEEPLLQQ